jgi:hypothetical protein
MIARIYGHRDRIEYLALRSYNGLWVPVCGDRGRRGALCWEDAAREAAQALTADMDILAREYREFLQLCRDSVFQPAADITPHHIVAKANLLSDRLRAIHLDTSRLLDNPSPDDDLQIDGDLVNL